VGLARQGGNRRGGRPYASSAAEIEECAIGLFLEKGFDQTSMAEIAAACGVGRTTLFRYFPSKADILWVGFDDHLVRLGELLRCQSENHPVLAAVEAAVLQALEEAADERQLWRRRFKVLEQTRSLRPSVSIRWFDWGRTVAGFVGERTGTHPESAIPASIGGAIQGAFLATLRSWGRDEEFDGDVVARMGEALGPICEALSPLIGEGRTESSQCQKPPEVM
jgi:TetR/AcrR family transcriptional regulator, regulator of mycofactocin system